jgi:hypothetical protein
MLILPPKRLDTVPQADEPGAARRICTADAIVADGNAQRAVERLDSNADNRRVRVLGHVGEQLGDDVVGSDLDPLGQTPLGAYVELDRDRGAACECVQRRREAALRQHGWMDPVRDLT